MWNEFKIKYKVLIPYSDIFGFHPKIKEIDAVEIVVADSFEGAQKTFKEYAAKKLVKKNQSEVVITDIEEVFKD